MSAWCGAKLNWPPLNNNLSNSGTEIDIAALLAASQRAGMADFMQWCAGVEKYHAAPVPLLAELPPPIWRAGSTLVREYENGASDSIIIAIPSLINRARILDLLPVQSLLRTLQTQHTVWLVDWQAPDAAELDFDLTDYIMQRLLPIIHQARQRGKKIYLLGYCMGGLLALAAAHHAKADLAGMVLLATPWDFAAYPAPARTALAQWQAALAPWLASGQPLAPEVLNILFTLLQPLAVYEKFKNIADAEVTPTFVAVEDWVNDGVPLPAKVAAECLGWFTGNQPASGTWQVAGQAVQPAQLKVPSLVIAPAKDVLVPDNSAAALARALPDANLLVPNLGHIGMMVSDKAPQQVWEYILNWLAAAK